MYESIRKFISSLQVQEVDAERKQQLDHLAAEVAAAIANGGVNLNFICTHNSRRSHLAQIWCQVAAYYHGLENVQCYSGGTEATAMYPLIGETISAQGLSVRVLADQDNPIYAVSYSTTLHPMIIFSKKYDDDFNPKSEFIAVMTCGSADRGCPIVQGAGSRFTITYVDPKASDGTPEESKVYHERSVQIATEMSYLMKTVARIKVI